MGCRQVAFFPKETLKPDQPFQPILAPKLARTALGPGWIGVSIHDEDEARAAIDDGADYVLAGNVYDSASHTTRPGRGADWLSRIASLGVPVIAIGGVTADRVAELLAAGAWGVAAIGALWRIPDSAKATMAFLDQLTP